MAIKIECSFHPLRMALHRREPVELGVTVTNQDPGPKKLSVKLLVSKDLSLSKGGFKEMAIERVESLGGKDSRRFYFEIYPKQMTSPGEQPIQVIVEEHATGFHDLAREYRHHDTLIVED